ncbi:uncharacterized protein DEA37_0001813 [Paragonimus westermani]|uniref:Uncharacterized protein n=1 Tax=Paragonimus westermani TaxID=34504 RepID=A0A5J4NDT5_9TREM|nr:uncharacterized protein DEA37_0001813 [Paragonimus westermani]
MASKSNRVVPTLCVPESKSASTLGSGGFIKRAVPQARSCGSSPHFVGLASTLSQDAVNLNWVREEAEWEKCSVNPGVARQVKTRNIIERRRLTALQTQLDRKLERELKRLTIERREFSDVLDNLLIRRRKSHQLNVRRHRRRGSHEVEMKSQPLSLNLICNENQRFQRDAMKSSYSLGSTPFTPPMSTRADIGRTSFHGGSSASIMSSPEMRRVSSSKNPRMENFPLRMHQDGKERQFSSGETVDHGDSTHLGGNSPLSKLMDNLRQTTKIANDSNTPNLLSASDNLEASRSDVTEIFSLN